MTAGNAAVIIPKPDGAVMRASGFTKGAIRLGSDEKNGSGKHLSGARVRLIAGAAILAAATAAAVFLFSKITVFCDDYWYGAFFRDGFSGFWELTKWHYLNFNGRALVHFAAEVVMAADKYIYMFVAPAMLVLVFFLGQRLQNKDVELGLTLASSGVCVAAVMALPVNFLKNSILWMSAGFNYLFPLALILPALWLLRRDLERGRLGVGTLILTFLCGATTEQCGIGAFVILGGYSALCWLRKKTVFTKAFLVCLLTGLGYLTVVFAPGTWVRIGYETGGGILSALRPSEFVRRVAHSMAYMTGFSGLPWLFALFAALTGVHALVTGKAPRALAAGIALAPVYLLLRALGQYHLGTLLSLIWFAAVTVVYLLREESAVRGLLLGGMMAILLVMVLTTAAAERTTMPAVFLLISVCASLICECLERLPRPAWPVASGAAALFFLILALPTINGYTKNSVIWTKNAKELRAKDGIITLDVDIDRNYSYLSYLDSMVYLKNAMSYYEITDEKITYESANGFVAGAYASGRAGLPIYELDGTLFVPIQDSIQLVGGESEWDYPHTGTWGRLDGHEYILTSAGEIIPYDMDTGTVTGESGYTDIRSPAYTYFAPMDVMHELFGIVWEYNEAENIYYLHKEG